MTESLSDYEERREAQDLDRTLARDLGVPVVDGEAAEDSDAYRALVETLRGEFGVKTAAEELLLERVVGLTWRLRRLARVERALIEGASLGLTAAHEDALKAKAESIRFVGYDVALESRNPFRLDEGYSSVFEFWEALRADNLPDPADVRRRLTAAAGAPRAAFIVREIEAIYTALADPSLTDADQQAQARKHQQVAIETLESMLQDFERHMEKVDDEGVARVTAKAESALVADPGKLRALAQHERGIDQALGRARAELRRAVARRRLREALRAAFG